MVFDPASIAQSITADCGAGHRGAVMLFSIATVSSRQRPALRREGQDIGASVHATERQLFTLNHIAAAEDSP
jgi:hypothetical protein